MPKRDLSILKDAHQHALDILRRSQTPHGFRASALPAGYPQVWGRDSFMALLGAIAIQDAGLIQTGKASLKTLGAHQSERGLVPLNVNPDTGYVSTENAGACDSNLLFILGHYLYSRTTHDLAFLKTSWKQIEKAMIWLHFQDMNECGLLEIPEAGNWMDLLSVRYNTLYDNVLYYAAELACIEMAKALSPEMGMIPCPIGPESIHERINLLMWVDRCWVAEHFAEHLEKLKAIRLEWFMLYHNIGTISSRPFYLPWVAFREYGDYCDSLGNLLAILTGVADGHRTEHILRYMRQVGISEPYPTKAIHPPIYPGEALWREYYRSRNLNLPHQYHNGGIWPMIGGFHVAALVRHKWRSEAERVLLALAEANRQGIEGEWEFSEWLHGESGHPMGYAEQTWSAALYLYAEAALHSGSLPLFDDLLKAKPASLRLNEQEGLAIRPGGGPA